MAPLLGYWKLRGLGNAIKFLLEYVGDEYEEKVYNYGPAPEYSLSEWLSDKDNLGLLLPNLPYYIDGDIKIVQSNSILRYIGRKHNLCGTNEKEKILVDILADQATDIRVAYVRLVYRFFDKERDIYFENFQKLLKYLSEVMGEHKWFVGDNITFPDFVLYEHLAVHRAIESTCLDNFPNLKAFMNRFEELPAIKRYMATPKFISYPLNGPMAFIGGK